MKAPLVVGNWKMHGNQADCQALARAIVQGLKKTNRKSRGRHRAAFYRACGGEKNNSREQDQPGGAKLPLATIRRFYRRSQPVDD